MNNVSCRSDSVYAALAGWVLGNMIPFWYVLKFAGWFRVPANEETMGLDDSYHGGTAYPGHGHDDFLDKSSAGNKVNGDAVMNGEGYNKVRCCMADIALSDVEAVSVRAVTLAHSAR